MSNWGKDDVLRLIEAYQREACLYVVRHPQYHNKHLRREALSRVAEKVSEVRPGTTPEEVSKKFHVLRNSFNTENKKKKDSCKSGAGTADVYVPSLWYFDKLSFLEEYYTPRKSVGTKVNSVNTSSISVQQGNTDSGPGSSTSTVTAQHTAHQATSQQTLHDLNTSETLIDCGEDTTFFDDHGYACTTVEITCDPVATSTQNVDGDAAFSLPFSPPPSRSRSPSTSSVSSIRPRHNSTSSANSGPTTPRSKLPRQDNAMEEALLSALKEPIVIPPAKKDGPIRSFLDFVGGVLEKLPPKDQSEIMGEIFSKIMAKQLEHNIQL